MHEGAGTGLVDPEAELRRLRYELYRPAASADAVERYVALRERIGEPEPIEQVEQAAASIAVTRRRRRRTLLLLLAATVVATAAAAAALLAIPHVSRDPGTAERLTTAGPYAVSDRDALGGLLAPDGPDDQAVLRAVRDSELPQLDVWDRRTAGLWSQQGTGPFSRRYDGVRVPAVAPRPFSVIVECDRPSRYRWTVLGTTPARTAVHALETAASASCGRTPTVATFVRPEGATVRGLDLAVGAGVRWSMAFVFPTD